MKIIALVGSPHGLKGSTAKLLSAVLDAAAGFGAESETIPLPGGTVLPCKACDVCHRKGICPQKDEFESIKKKILESDALILASPNYMINVSAQLKAFMDRCAGVVHTTGFEGKYGASVISSGSGDDESVAGYLNKFLVITGVRPVGAVWAPAHLLKGDSLPGDLSKKASELAAKLMDWWKNKTTTPEIEQGLARFQQRIKQVIEFRKDDWTYEYEFWKSRRS